MNVFIIGATGYIGRAVTARALNAGHRVTALVRSEASASRLPPGDVRVVAGSVEDLQALEKGLETADAAIYLAIQGTQGASDADRAALMLAACLGEAGSGDFGDTLRGRRRNWWGDAGACRPREAPWRRVLRRGGEQSGVAACQKLAAVPMRLAGDRSPSLMVGRPQTLG